MKNAIMLKKLVFILAAALFAAAAVFAAAFAAEKPQTALAAAEQQAETSAETDPSAEGETADGDDQKGTVALAAGIAVGVAALGGAIGMGIAIAKSNESIARQPEMKNDIRSGMMLGLVFIETAIIYALILSILIIFVL